MAGYCGIVVLCYIWSINRQIVPCVGHRPLCHSTIMPFYPLPVSVPVPVPVTQSTYQSHTIYIQPSSNSLSLSSISAMPFSPIPASSVVSPLPLRYVSLIPPLPSPLYAIAHTSIASRRENIFFTLEILFDVTPSLPHKKRALTWDAHSSSGLSLPWNLFKRLLRPSAGSIPSVVASKVDGSDGRSDCTRPFPPNPCPIQYQKGVQG